MRKRVAEAALFLFTLLAAYSLTLAAAGLLSF